MKKYLLNIVFVMFIIGLPTQAQADLIVHEFKVGLLKHDVSDLWSGFSRESGVDLNLELLFTPSTKMLSGTLRPALGVSLNNNGGTSKIYLDARWQRKLSAQLELGLGIGLAVHDGESQFVRVDRKALGASLLLHFPLELIYRVDNHNTFSLFFDHVSNGYLESPNEGLDTLGLRYGYRF